MQLINNKHSFLISNQIYMHNRKELIAFQHMFECNSFSPIGNKESYLYHITIYQCICGTIRTLKEQGKKHN